MTKNAVHTSAQDAEPDMFGNTQAGEPSHIDAFHLKVKGVLIETAEVITRTAADGAEVPVICMDLRPLSGAVLKLHAELVFCHPEFGRARTKAQTLCKGACVVIATPLEGIYRDFLPDVRSVALLPPSSH